MMIIIMKDKYIVIYIIYDEIFNDFYRYLSIMILFLFIPYIE